MLNFNDIIPAAGLIPVSTLPPSKQQEKLERGQERKKKILVKKNLVKKIIITVS